MATPNSPAACSMPSEAVRRSRPPCCRDASVKDPSASTPLAYLKRPPDLHFRAAPPCTSPLGSSTVMATGIGETLRTARRQQRVSLTDAAAETRVRESYLAALEEEDFAALGGDVYVKGFLRSYARFLRLDPEPLLAAYRAQHQRP